jgi:hypothetical protein
LLALPGRTSRIVRARAWSRCAVQPPWPDRIGLPGGDVRRVIMVPVGEKIAAAVMAMLEAEFATSSGGA